MAMAAKIIPKKSNAGEAYTEKIKELIPIDFSCPLQIPAAKVGLCLKAVVSI